MGVEAGKETVSSVVAGGDRAWIVSVLVPEPDYPSIVSRAALPRAHAVTVFISATGAAAQTIKQLTRWSVL